MLCVESTVSLRKALSNTDERASSHLLQDELWFGTQAAFRALNPSLTVNLGKVFSSSVLGALPPGRRSNPGLNGSNRTGNGSVRGDEVTPEELSGTLVLYVLQRDFQTRLEGIGHGCL